MNILVVSDTHGDIEKAVEMYGRVNGELTSPEGRSKKIDLIIHCGDYQRDASALEQRVNVPVVSVPGNCDRCFERSFQIVSAPSGNILVTHGHMENVDRDMSGLVYLAEENGCNAVCFGHTHIPVNTEFDGVHLINPGSLTRPRDMTNGSCAYIVSDENSFQSKIVYYDAAHAPKKKAQGGFLRGLLNWSDGQ